MEYRIKIRRALAEVRPDAECLDGKVFNFEFGWRILKSDSSIYVGEVAMISRDSGYPKEAPIWIASGDLGKIGDE